MVGVRPNCLKVDTEVLLQRLIHTFGLSVGFRVISCSEVKLDIQDLTAGAVGSMHKLLIAFQRAFALILNSKIGSTTAAMA